MFDPLKAEPEGFRLRRAAEYPGSHQIGEEKNRWYGDRIGDPHQCHGEWQIHAEEDRGAGGENHLKRYGNERHEESHGETA